MPGRLDAQAALRRRRPRRGPPLGARLPRRVHAAAGAPPAQPAVDRLRLHPRAQRAARPARPSSRSGSCSSGTAPPRVRRARAVAVVLDAGTAPLADARRCERRVVTRGVRVERWPTGRLELDLAGARPVPRGRPRARSSCSSIARVRAAEREAFLDRARAADRRPPGRERRQERLPRRDEPRAPHAAQRDHRLLRAARRGRRRGRRSGDGPRPTSEHIHGSGLHLLELVNDVLDLARVEAGRLDLKPDPVRARRASSGRRSPTLQPLADQKQLAVDAASSAPMTIEADPAPRPPDRPATCCRTRSSSPTDGGEIRLSLDRDGGERARLTRRRHRPRASAPADLERIFEAFQQGDGEGHDAAPRGHRPRPRAHAPARRGPWRHGRRHVRGRASAASSRSCCRSRARRPPTSARARARTLAGDRPSVLVIEDDPAAQELLRRPPRERRATPCSRPRAASQGLAWLARGPPRRRPPRHPPARPRRLGDPPAAQERSRDPVDPGHGRVRRRRSPARPGARRRRLRREADRARAAPRGARPPDVHDEGPDPDRHGARHRRRSGRAPAATASSSEPDGFQVIDAPRRRSRAGAGPSTERPDLILLDALPARHRRLRARRGAPRTIRRPPTIPIWLTTPGGARAGGQGPPQRQRPGRPRRAATTALAALRSWLETAARPPASRAPAPAPRPSMARLGGPA